MRPEVVAFRELEALVRNLGDQLAGYRRRALLAEGRQKELERTLEALTAEGERLRAQLAEMQAPAGSGSDHRDVTVDADALRRENDELRDVLAQASERTAQAVERVRFLRQQMTVEK